MGKTTCRRVTNKDVAQRAGVSTAVVSYVMNDGPRPTSPQVRERVLRAAHELDYHPNAIARGLRKQRSHAIAFIVCDYEPLDVFVSPYSAGLLTGLVDQLKRDELYLMVYPAGLNEDMTALRRFLRDGRLDGVVLRLAQEPPANAAVLDTIQAVGLPCICIERTASGYGFPSITIDETNGGYEATRYLLAQGHRRIAHIHGDLRYQSARMRLQRYKDALAEGGLPVDQGLICGGTWNPADGAKAMSQLLALPQPPDAVFAANDSLALSALHVIQSRCPRGPEDIAVMGFDDIPLAAESQPPLTTMRIPLVEMGRRAAMLISSVVEGASDIPESVVISTELVRRQTA